MSETSKIRNEVLEFCNGIGLDIGSGGDRIAENAITFDLPEPYSGDGSNVDIKGDCRLLPFTDGLFDYIFSSHVLEDFKETKEIILHWLSKIKYGGYLILYLPDEKLYKSHCEQTNQNYNHNHKAEMNLQYIRDITSDLRLISDIKIQICENGKKIILTSGFKYSVSIVKQIEKHEIYSFLIVLKKLF